MGKWSTSPPDIEKQRTSRPLPHYCPPTAKPWFPWLVPVIFMANIVMFAYSVYLNNCPATIGENQCLFYNYLKRFSFQAFRENPLLGPSATTTTLKQLGALDRKLVVEQGQGWRLLSCMWLHAGIIHLLANMLSLLFIGVQLEQEFGFFRIGILYVLSGFGGSFLSTLTLSPSERPTVLVGASGAFGFLPHVDNSAHIGGFIVGFLLGFILLIRPQFDYVSSKYIPAGYDVKSKPKHKYYQYVLWITALLVLIFDTHTAW